MHKHHSTLGALMIAYGCLLTVFYIVGYAISSAFIDLSTNDQNIIMVVYLARYLIGIVIGLYVIAFISIGFAVRSERPWASVASLILGIVSLPLFPFGTALGTYAILVFILDQSKMYSSDNQEENNDDISTETLDSSSS